MKIIKTAAIVVFTLLVFTLIGVYSGVFNVAADDPHWSVTSRLIEAARDRSITSRSKDIAVPANLSDEKYVASGAGEYAEMCTGCHLAPGMQDTEMRTGLYPKPPNLAEAGARRTPAQQFWIVKHGLKMTGMPAWGLTHDDERIWSMVAFLQELPKLSPDKYKELIDAGEGGHHHEGMDHDEHEQESQEPKLPAVAAPAAAAVDNFQKLLAAADTNGAGALLDPQVLIYESGGVERSRAEYASHHLMADSAFLKDADVQVISRNGNAVDDLAWIATEAELKTKGSKPMDLVTTETMVLKRGPEGWHVAHIHWSSRPKNE
jgi:mono/diheme cytochrome c family protein/ketosteroid isomerase-like protein